MFAVIRPYIPWLLTTCISFILIFSNNLPQVTALRAKIGDAVTILASPISNLSRYNKLGSENRKLRKQIAEMSLMVGELQSSGAERDRLRKMLDFYDKSEFRLVPGVVVGFSPDPAVRGVVVDCGSNRGVRKNVGVISADGVVGRVYRCGKRSSAVQFLTDLNIGISGRTAVSREFGIVHAADDGALTLDGVPVTAEIKRGEKVVTAGLDGIFPKELTIGYVKEIKLSEDSWLLEVIVNPVVNFNQLEELFVIIGADGEE